MNLEMFKYTQYKTSVQQKIASSLFPHTINILAPCGFALTCESVFDVSFHSFSLALFYFHSFSFSFSHAYSYNYVVTDVTVKYCTMLKIWKCNSIKHKYKRICRSIHTHMHYMCNAKQRDWFVPSSMLTTRLWNVYFFIVHLKIELGRECVLCREREREKSNSILDLWCIRKLTEA